MTDWPDGEAIDETTEKVRALAVNLREAMGSLSLREVGDRTGVNHAAVRAILEGRVWADVRTLARLEVGLGVSLWPAQSVGDISSASPTGSQ